MIITELPSDLSNYRHTEWGWFRRERISICAPVSVLAECAAGSESTLEAQVSSVSKRSVQARESNQESRRGNDRSQGGLCGGRTNQSVAAIYGKGRWG